MNNITGILAIYLRQGIKLVTPVFINRIGVLQVALVQTLKVCAVTAIKQRCTLQLLHPMLTHLPTWQESD